jgi:hypothetical protein
VIIHESGRVSSSHSPRLSWSNGRPLVPMTEHKFEVNP